VPFDPARFFAAFKPHRLVTPAVAKAGGKRVEFDVYFKRPDVLVLADDVHSTDFRIEYETRSVTLNVGDRIEANCKHYRVRQPPMAQGDGFFTQALLEEVLP
jgi:hypothetical protein